MFNLILTVIVGLIQGFVGNQFFSFLADLFTGGSSAA